MGSLRKMVKIIEANSKNKNLQIKRDHDLIAGFFGACYFHFKINREYTRT